MLYEQDPDATGSINMGGDESVTNTKPNLYRLKEFDEYRDQQDLLHPEIGEGRIERTARLLGKVGTGGLVIVGIAATSFVVGALANRSTPSPEQPNVVSPSPETTFVPEGSQPILSPGETVVLTAVPDQPASPDAPGAELPSPASPDGLPPSSVETVTIPASPDSPTFTSPRTTESSETEETSDTSSVPITPTSESSTTTSTATDQLPTPSSAG